MGISKLIKIAAILASIAVSSGHLPQILHTVRLAQLHLIKESSSSHWGQAMLLPASKLELPRQ